MDHWLPELSCAELKVLLYLMRRTFGFHRNRVEVGLRRICEGIPGKDRGTGLHLETASDAAKRLRARGLLSFERVSGRRTIYTLRFAKEVYGKSEHHCSENPNTEVYGKSEHKERKSSSSETKIKKKRFSGGSGEQTAGTPKPEQNTSKPNESKLDDDDEKAKTSKPTTYASPHDELRAIYRSKAGQEISRDLLNRISETCELRGFALSRFVEELRSHVPNHWKNPAGFLTVFARKIASTASGSSTTSWATVPLTVKETPRCSKCRGIGRVDGGYCDCQMGVDLKRVEGWATAQPVSPGSAS